MGFRALTAARGCQLGLRRCCGHGPDFWTCPSQRGHHALGDASATEEGRAWPGAERFVMRNIIEGAKGLTVK